MQIHSLEHRTDLIFARFLGETHERGDYLVVRQPRNPTYHFGNYLIFARPPRVGDYAAWDAAFAREIPGANHRVMLWNPGAPPEVDEFLAAGYVIDTNVTLSATANDLRRPPKWCDEVSVRPLSTDEQWEQSIQNDIQGRDERYGFGPYTVFARRKFAGYREMARAGMGHWYGAFLRVDGRERVVADLGIFVDRMHDPGLGRFQSVGTHPDFRRRGICGTLVYQAARHAFDTMGATILAMVADESYHAARIYESVGFRVAERIDFLYKQPPRGGG